MKFEENDTVKVTVNSRARKHLGISSFKAKVENITGKSVVFSPIGELQEGFDTHTWYSDIGYIHGYHKGLERYSDIGKVRSVEVLD